MEGETVEKVVPLWARDEMEGTCLGYVRWLDDSELMVSVLLVDESVGLVISSRSCRAWSIEFISFAVFWIVDNVTAPLS